jgi:hypothetical protein
MYKHFENQLLQHTQTLVEKSELAKPSPNAGIVHSTSSMPPEVASRNNNSGS